MKYYDIFAQYLDNVLPTKEEQLVRCIFHDDTHPSLSINIEKGLFYCHACRIGGDINDFLRLVSDKKRTDILYEEVERFHAALVENKKLIDFLANAKKITFKVVKERKLGYDELTGRYVIPVYDIQGELVGIRKYKPYSHTQKIIQYGEKFYCYPADVLIKEGDSLVFAEGEMDCLALLSGGVDAISLLPPSAVNNVEFIAEYLKNKMCIVVYDSDTTGKRLANELVAQLKLYAKSVAVVSLLPYKDVGDFLSSKTVADLINLINTSAKVVTEETRDDIDSLPYLSVSQLPSVANIDKEFRVDYNVTAKNVNVYVVPLRYTINCPMGFDFCEKCIMSTFGGSYEDKLKNEDIPVLVGYSNEVLKRIIRARYNIPTKCFAWRLIPVENKIVTMTKVSNIIDEKQLTEAINMFPLDILLDEDVIEANRQYTSRVILTKSNKTSELVGIAFGASPIQQFMQYELLPSMYDFQPKNGQSIYEKYMEIVEDLEYIVNVNERRELIMAMDLVYHSVLEIKFDRRQFKGYIDALVIGDTRTGKTSVAKGLSDFYKLGEIIDGSNTTVAGLIGGILSRETEGFFISWGVLPQNDRKLVIIDEADELSEDVIERLSYVRGTGIAELVKIYKNKVNARVRLIMITNPMKGMKMSDYTYPILAITDFAKSKQDIARFDYCLTVMGDVSTIKVPDRTIKHDIDAYYNLVRYAWNISASDILYAFDFDALIEVCNDISKRYTSDIPLIEKNSLYEKVLRIATAVAVRLFNYDEKIGKIVVSKEHLQFVVEFFDTIYKKETNGYYSYSQHVLSEMSSYDIADIISSFSLVKNPRTFFDKIKFYTAFTKTDMQELLAVNRDELDEVIQCLIRNNLIRRLHSGYYVKTQLFSKVASELEGMLGGNKNTNRT
ncbi:MAG: CHC2 zinc finger domain-containing protein [candidate division WOR-3 bacterium]